MSASIHALLEEREKTHGSFDAHALYTQEIKRIVRKSEQCLTDAQLESLEMIAHKIGRILAGNADFRDHWLDISGYAMLVADILERQNTKP